MSEKFRKVFISVITKFSKDGAITPVSFMWEDDSQYEVDRVLDIQKAASQKAGGHGVRYTVKVCGKEVYMFLEDSRWFMEGKVIV